MKKHINQINKSLDNIEKSMDDCIAILIEMNDRLESKEERGFWKSIHLDKLFLKSREKYQALRSKGSVIK